MDTRKRQRDLIMEYIYDHGGITNMEAVINLHIGRLSGRIKDLRDDGFDIVTDMVQGENSRYGVYRFTKKQRNNLCKCYDCGLIFEADECDTEKWREGDVVRVYTNCPRCGMSLEVDEYEDDRTWSEKYGFDIWAGHEI